MIIIETLWHDICYALRLLRKRPVLLVATTVSIGIAVGVNVSVHAVLQRVLFESLVTATAPERLVRIRPGISYLNYLDLRRADLPVDLATMTMTGLMSVAAGLLAMTGLYGVVSYTVNRRTFEIGVRIALGAKRTDIIRLIMRDCFSMLGFGCAAGGLAALVVARAIHRIFAVGSVQTDAIVLASVLLLLLTTGILASLWPAWRAACANPLSTLHGE